MTERRVPVVVDIEAEARRLVERAASTSLVIRVLGGVAIALSSPHALQRRELRRPFHDIDLVAPKKASREIRDLLLADGYTADTHFNALHGATRLLFYDEPNERKVDVFLGVFEMCHTLNLEPRLALPGPALPPADLLLLKLQVVELTEKDVTDALALMLQYEPVQGDDPATLSATYIAHVCARDWGWFTTIHDNLNALRDHTPLLKAAEDASLVRDRIDRLLSIVDAAPKSMGWRLRNKVGRRVVWYQLPEDVRH